MDDLFPEKYKDNIQAMKDLANPDQADLDEVKYDAVEEVLKRRQTAMNQALRHLITGLYKEPVDVFNMIIKGEVGLVEAPGGFDGYVVWYQGDENQSVEVLATWGSPPPVKELGLRPTEVRPSSDPQVKYGTKADAD